VGLYVSLWTAVSISLALYQPYLGFWSHSDTKHQPHIKTYIVLGMT